MYNKDKCKNNAYSLRDHDAARDNITTYMNDHGFTPEEKIEVMAFFEKYWNKYAKKEPVIAVIPQDIGKLKRVSEINYQGMTKNHKPSEAIKTMDQSTHNVINTQTTEKIDTSRAQYYNIPSLSLLKEKVAEIERNNKQENQQDGALNF